ncbi:MAG: peptidoglycan-binding protein [Myxococcales bacterium]|nr:peptidoglycan-binding protein [Myxococcales bacterium]
MSTGSKFSQFLKTQIDCRAVWPPVVTPIALGDYGVVVGDNFQKLGHVSDFGVTLEVERGEATSLNVSSSGVRATRLAAGAPVHGFGGLGQVQARLALEFSAADAFVLKCRRLERAQIRNLGAIGRQLGRARARDGQTWRHLPWRIVWQLYTGHDVVCLANRSAGTRVEFSGEAHALQQLEGGTMSAGVGFQSSHGLALEVLGQTGPVGLGLARVKYIGGGIAFFSSGADEDDDEAIERVDADEPAPAADAEPADERDEPAEWAELEHAATDPREAAGDDPLSFGDSDEISTVSVNHWLQSCLRRLVDPALVVDGAVGLRTRTALKTYQRRTGRLTPDGLAGPRTIAALATEVGVPCPGAHVSTPVAAPAAQGEPAELVELVSQPAPADELRGEFRVHAVDLPDGPQYIISSSDDEVRFSYWGERHSGGAGDGFNLSQYRGGKKGLVTAATLSAQGYAAGAVQIFQANALKESGGLFGAINTWDDQIVSWGVAQFAGRAGTLAALLAGLMEDPVAAPAFRRYFVANGLTVAHGRYPRKAHGGKPERTHTGWHAVVATPDGPRLGDDAWMYVRRTPRLLGALMLAGNDLAIQVGQARFWMAHFLERAVHKVVVRDHRGEHKVCDYVTSTYELGLVARLYNWMPAHVQPWFAEFFAELARRHPDLDIRSSATWTAHPRLAEEFAELLKDKRRRVKKGSYDTYGLTLDRAPGSYFRPAPQESP